MAPKVAIIYYSMYGHILELAKAEKKGIESAGGQANIYQTAETLSDEILANLNAPQKSNYPVVEASDLLQYDAVLFGIPTCYGNFPAQWKTFWDKTGSIWATGGYWGKYAGLFVSSCTLRGGQESAAIATMSTLSHHGFIYVALGYKNVYPLLTNLEDIHGGSAWGAHTFVGADGSRQPTALELQIAEAHGKAFYEAAAKAHYLTDQSFFHDEVFELIRKQARESQGSSIPSILFVLYIALLYEELKVLWVAVIGFAAIKTE
ncbi:NADH-quinone oxidoreductase Pst2 [Penicillium lagena]|uniref:NADH-quinone oxidoreductase Pst2 n=1 Tax=Penicillium lagena TaxID=94218 RepID=UPI002540FE54|nr:NADH-quinone oxidoreductase Pst2 [Penicillium lagena]KAJ5623920.1 NADH-quinone oxidoreductase Pst2 [Penicillium lagena]